MLLRNEVLAVLERNRGQSVSGEEIAKGLGVSRGAVWKAVRALREEGYRIEAANNRGYRLGQDNDLLSAEGIRAQMDAGCRGLNVLVFDVLDSTNNEAKRLIAGGAPLPLLVVADAQTGGRGRLGRSFYSPPGAGAYLSFALDSGKNPVTATTAAAVAVVRAIDGLAGLPVQIKWVNDIYLYNKKVCGILTEAITNPKTGRIEQIVVGVGVNVSPGDFPEELKHRAAALGLPSFSRAALIAAIADHLVDILGSETPASYMDEYRARSMVIGKPICYCKNDGTFIQATALNVDDAGGLLVEHLDGTRLTLRTGEITLRLGSGQAAAPL